jgi:hypothetical protein
MDFPTICIVTSFDSTTPETMRNGKMQPSEDKWSTSTARIEGNNYTDKQPPNSTIPLAGTRLGGIPTPWTHWQTKGAFASQELKMSCIMKNTNKNNNDGVPKQNNNWGWPQWRDHHTRCFHLIKGTSNNRGKHRDAT